jgi:hypothetical protein
MKQCETCKAQFVNDDAYQIHLGVGAPIFHTCNDASEMTTKGMMQDQGGAWQIDPSLIVHEDKQHRLGRWARLKSELANPADWE